MLDVLIYICYAALVVTIVVLSIKLGKYVDIIDAKSNISGAFIGGVMLAAVTSLPELFTSLSAVWIVHENSMIIGNILGSDLINLAFFGMILLIFGRGLKNGKFNTFYYAALGVSLGMYALVAIGLYFAEYMRFTWFSVISPLILVLYVLFVNKMPKTSEADDEKKDEGITLKQAVVRFAVCAAVLIGASVALTFCTDIVADKLSLDKTFAGALFLGVATSLPELMSSVTLCHRGNYNAAAGNIIGSNMFNFAILFVADVFAFMPNGSGVYILNGDSKWLLIFGVVASVVTLFMMLLHNNRHKALRPAAVGVYALNAVPPVLYIIYLLITTGIF